MILRGPAAMLLLVAILAALLAVASGAHAALTRSSRPCSPGTCPPCDALERSAFALCLASILTALAAAAYAAWAHSLTPNHGPAILGVLGVTTGFRGSASWGRRMGAGGPVLLGLRAQAQDRYAFAMAKAGGKHEVVIFRANHSTKPFIACSCKWSYLHDSQMAPYYAADVLLDEFSSHRKRARIGDA